LVRRHLAVDAADLMLLAVRGAESNAEAAADLDIKFGAGRSGDGVGRSEPVR
jgi:hypothetical protein